MAVKPTNWQNAKRYKCYEGNVPKHDGVRKSFGPFVVTEHNKIKVVEEGGIAVFGEGWKPDDFDGTTLNVGGNRVIDGNQWGFITRNSTGYFIGVASSSDMDIYKLTESGGAFTSMAAVTDGSGLFSDLANDKFHTYKLGAAADGLLAKSYIVRVTDSKIRAYQLLEPSTGDAEIIENYITKTPTTRLRVFTVYGDDTDGELDATFHDDLPGGGYLTDNEFETNSAATYGASGSQIKSLASFLNTATPARAAIASDAEVPSRPEITPNPSYIYLEDIKYDESGKAYKSISEQYPIHAVIDGESVFQIKYWPNSPITGKQPYVVRTIRIINSREAADGFWVA